jgi:hypothetical protein
MQLSVTVRNAILDAVESTIGTSARLQIFNGTPPASCASADSGTMLAEMLLAVDWMDDAASGSKPKLGTYEDTNADQTGTAGHFRLKDSAGTTCHMQGTITGSGGGGDMEFDSTTITAGQLITITSFTLLAGNS